MDANNCMCALLATNSLSARNAIPAFKHSTLNICLKFVAIPKEGHNDESCFATLPSLLVTIVPTTLVATFHRVSTGLEAIARSKAMLISANATGRSHFNWDSAACSAWSAFSMNRGFFVIW